VAVLLGTVKIGLFRTAWNEPVSGKKTLTLLVVGCAQKAGWAHVTDLGTDKWTD